MNWKIVVGFLAGAIAATTGAFLALRRAERAPVATLNIVVTPPPAPNISVMARTPESPARKRGGRSAPPFYLDPRPRAGEPEPEPPPVPMLAALESAPAIIPAIDVKLPPPAPHVVTLDTGTELTVRLAEKLSTKDRRRGESFAATLEHNLILEGFVIAEHGSRVEGRIAESDDGGRIKGLARLSLELTALHTTDGQTIPIRTTHFVRSAETSKMDDGAKVALGAGIGAAIGAASAQGKGAAIGAAAGAAAGAASVAMTKGKPAELGIEARLTFRLEDPVTITEKLN